MLKNSRFWILFFLLIAPILFALWLYQGEPQYDRLEIYGGIEVSEAGDTTYHTIPDFKLTNQQGEKFSLNDTEGKIFVAKFIFTRCPKECPVMTSNMHRVQERYRDMDDIMFLSFTIDPGHDTAEVLYEYAERFNVDHEKWQFLTGDRDVIHELARNGFFVTVKEGDRQATDYLHSELFILIDRQNRIRGLYNGMREDEVVELIDEIRVLQHEYN